MYKKMIPFILFFVISLQTFLFALPTEDLFQAAFLPKEIGSNEKIAIHPNGQFITYTIHQKPQDGFPDDAYIMASGVPFNRFHSCIYMHQLQSGEVTQIGPNDANCWRPCFSPDGQKIAFYCDKGDSSRLWIHDIALGQSSLVHHEGIRTNGLAFIDRPYWSPDSSTVYIPILPLEKHNILYNDAQIQKEASILLYSSDKKPSYLNIPAYGRIASVNLKTDECDIIAPVNDNEPLSSQFILSKTGKYVANLSFLTDRSPPSWDLRVCSTADPKKIFILAKHLLLKGRIAEIAWHPYEDKLAYVEKGKVFLASWEENGELTLEEVSKGYEFTFSTAPLRFSTDGKTLLVGANPIQFSYSITPQIIFAFSLEGHSPRQIVIPKEWHYLSTLETQEGDFWQPEKDTLTAYLLIGTDNAVARFNLETNHHEILWKGKSSLKGIVASRETNQVFYIHESLNDPQNIYQATSDFSNSTRLSHIDPRQDSLDEIKAIIIESTVPRYDGTLEKVETTILLPKGTIPGRPVPAIVSIYPGAVLQSQVNQFGGGHIASLPTRLILEQGYAVILPDLRIGPEGEPGNPLQETVDRLLPQLYQAANLGLIDINRLGIIGQSYGGYGTAGITTKTNIFQASVCISGLYDLVGSYGAFSKNWEGFADTDYYENRQARMGTHPWDNILRYLENSPYYLAKDINTPLLLIHGEKDTTYPVEESKKMFTALNRLGKKVDLAVYKKEGHVIDDWSHTNAIDAVKRILCFFDQHLSPKNDNN